MSLWTFIGLFKGKATTPWPKKGEAHGQQGVIGFPQHDPVKGIKGSEESAAACPTEAITIQKGKKELTIDYGKCVNCRRCSDQCSSGTIQESTHWDVGRLKRSSLLHTGIGTPPEKPDRETASFKRSLYIRHVDAGSCNGCESELDATTNPFYDMHRLGLFFTPSPRFADLLLVTGPVTYNMKEPLLEAYRAMAEPRWVMAVGTCAVSGGTNGGGYACYNGLEGILPVDLYLPGCPPNPAAIISALLTFLNRKMQGDTHREHSK